MAASTHSMPARVPAWDDVVGPERYHRTKPHPYCPVCKEPVLGQYIYVDEDNRNKYYHVDCYSGELCQRCLRHGDVIPLTADHMRVLHAS